jgi:uncharacterized damage-inducible protein DinB
MKKMLFVLPVLVVTTVAIASALQAKTPPTPAPVTQKPMTTASPITDAERNTYNAYKSYLVKSAEQMPEKDYASRPATMPASDGKEIRNFGEVLSHIAEENGLFCGTAAGAKEPPSTKPTGPTKAAIQKALADSFMVCDRAWGGTTDQNATTPVDLPFGLGKSTRLAALSFNTAHDAEHYGNVVTYLRAKGLVPPSSQPAK